MKTSVINKFLAFSSDSSSVPQIIIMASLCDFLNGKKILKERLNTDIREDVDYLAEQNDEFAKVKSFDEKWNLFSSSSFENLYKKMKEESFIGRDSDEPDMDIVELINTKFCYRFRFIEFMTKKNFSNVIVKWLKTDQHAKIAFCPYNNLVDVESGLSDVFKLYQSEVNALKLMAKQIILICNGKKFESEAQVFDFDVFQNHESKYDVGFSFPSLNIKVGRLMSDTLDKCIIKKMMSNVTGKFCVITTTGFAFGMGKQAAFRKEIIDSNRLKAVVGLPSGMISSAGVSCLALFFDVYDKSQDSVMIMDLSGEQCKDLKNSGRNIFEFNEYACKALDSGLAYVESPIAKKVRIEEIIKNDYRLDPSIYVVSEEYEKTQEQILKGTVKLCDVVDFCRVTPSKGEEEGDEYYEVSASDIDSTGFVKQPTKQILLSKKEGREKNCLRKDDIIFAIKGSVGKVGLVTEEHDNWLLNQSFVILRRKNNDWPIEFIFRQLKSNAMKQYILSRATGTIIPSLTMSVLKNIPLVEPSDEEVQKQLQKHQRQIEIAKQMEALQKEQFELDNF